MMNLELNTSIFLSQSAPDLGFVMGSPQYMITHGFSNIAGKFFKRSLVYFAVAAGIE